MNILNLLTRIKLNQNNNSVFKEFKNDTYKVIAIYAKKARGLMSRFLIERKSTSVDDIKLLFNVDGYSFDSALSNNQRISIYKVVARGELNPRPPGYESKRSNHLSYLAKK